VKEGLHPETHFIMFLDVLSVLSVLFVLLVWPDMFCGAGNDRKPSFHTQITHFIMFLNVLSVLSVLSVLCFFSLPPRQTSKLAVCYFGNYMRSGQDRNCFFCCRSTYSRTNLALAGGQLD
jgi:hypothetical protein